MNTLIYIILSQDVTGNVLQDSNTKINVVKLCQRYFLFLKNEISKNNDMLSWHKKLHTLDFIQ